MLVYSDDTLAEFTNVFDRPKFDKYLSAEKRKRAIVAFEKTAQRIHTSVKIDTCRDPGDNKFLELAN